MARDSYLNEVVTHWINLDEYIDALGSLDKSKITIYHKPAWIEAVGDGFSCTIKFLCSRDSSGVLAVTPFMLKKRDFFRCWAPRSVECLPSLSVPFSAKT